MSEDIVAEGLRSVVARLHNPEGATRDDPASGALAAIERSKALLTGYRTFLQKEVRLSTARTVP